MRIVIPSQNPKNLVACVETILEKDPAWKSEDFVVVDDGAREEAESLLPGVVWVEGVKPFVFSRNCNLGIRVADDDVLLMNDDALLVTPGGVTLLNEVAKDYRCLGLISGVMDNTGNVRQHPKGTGTVRIEPFMVCFVAVRISKVVQEKVGLLDEDFMAYGFEDDDYCRRVREAGFAIGIFDGCEFNHSHLQSTFRSKGHQPLAPGLEIFLKKWGSREY